jgi:hypothetical protein
MKKIILAAAVVATGSLFMTANANVSTSKVNKETRRQIRKERRIERADSWFHSADPATVQEFWFDFPDAKDVSWKESDFAEATFLDGEVLKTAYYDTDNKLIGTTTHVDFSALPEKAQQKIHKKYPGFYAEEVILFDDNEENESDMNLFATAFQDEDCYFPVLTDGSTKMILQVDMNGDVSFFRQIN